MTGDIRAYWDDEAATFNDEPDHGLREPSVRRAWIELLERPMPPPPADVADSRLRHRDTRVLLGEAGHRVRGLDVSDRMVAAAARKRGQQACRPTSARPMPRHLPTRRRPSTSCSPVTCCGRSRDPADALRRWTRLLRPGGRLVLIEGRWATGAGICASDCRALVVQHRREAVVERLDDPALWGRTIEDERYVLLSLD